MAKVRKSWNADPEVRKALKAQAAAEGKTMSEFVEDEIIKSLELRREAD